MNPILLQVKLYISTTINIPSYTSNTKNTAVNNVSYTAFPVNNAAFKASNATVNDVVISC